MADRYVDDVDSKIRNGKVTVFIEKECSYSKNAVEILKKFNFVPGGLEVVDITGKANVQDYLQRRTKLPAVPYIFFGKECIGGLSSLESRRCQLPRILQQIGAQK